jgi:hypothetical protein
MRRMAKSRCLIGLVTTALFLSLVSSCSRPGGLQAGADSQTQREDLPFHQPDRPGDSSAVSGDPGLKDTEGNAGLPFRANSSLRLPSGTLLTVRLESPIVSGGNLNAPRTFAAVVDAPVIIGEANILDRGTAVKGRLECAHASESERGVGYVCLTLDSILVEGKAIPLQTSDLFVRGADVDAGNAPGTPAPSSPAIRIRKGHRLTFRLTSDVVFDEGTTPPSK